MDFDIKAAGWDTEKRIKRAKIISDEIMKSVQIQKHWNALDFGCGTGLVSFNLIDKFEHITLIDTSEGMVNAVKDKINASKADNMTAVRQDINSWSQLHKNKYNIIYTSMVLHHISDLDTTQKHLYEMLTYNGYLCIIDLVEDDGSFHKDELDFKGHNGFNPDQLSKILEKLGFNSISSHVFYEGIKETEGSEIKYSLFLMTARK